MEITYKPSDFTPHGVITENVIKHVIENIEDFEPRYCLATDKMVYLRCPLSYADDCLWDSIVESALLYFDWNEDEIPECFYEDLEEVFG